MAFFRTPNYERIHWPDLLSTTLKCEALGFDSVFIADHVFLGNDGEIFECWTLMAALAAVTTKLEISPIHLCNNFRHPAITAKSLSTLSHVSAGRVTLFYDYSWRKAEFDAYGIPFGNDDERIERMDEGLSIIKGMLNEPAYSFTGKHYQVENAINTPQPLKKIPIWMGESDNPKMVKSIVKNADVFNSMPCSVAAFSKKKAVIEKECLKQGRELSSVQYSFETQILIRETEEEIDQLFEEFDRLKDRNNSLDDDIIEQLIKVNPHMVNYSSRSAFENEFIIGTPETVKIKIDQYIEQGVEHFMFWFMDYPSHKSIDIFSEKLIPHYKGIK